MTAKMISSQFFYFIRMTTRQDQLLQSLDDLLRQDNVKKACTLGTIIDSTNAYFDYKENKYVKKIKIIDESMNSAITTATFRYGYCTVMFFSEKIESLPNPFAIGDILYLRRFAFQIYDQSFQARNNPSNYCSWALLHGNFENKEFAEYQLSSSNMNLNEVKYESMKQNVRNLREFSRRFLQKNTVLLTVPAGVKPKDQDFVVQIIRKSEQGTLRVRDGKREMVLKNCPTFVQEKQIAKLRSVAKVIQNEDGQNQVVNNNFTSLIKLPEWTADAQTFLQNQSAIEVEEQTEMYTDLSYLNSAPLNEIQGKKFFIRCEVFNISAESFKEAVKFYDQKKQTVSDSPKDNTVPVYKFVLSCQDDSIKNDKTSKLNDIWLFSYDGQGSDFVERIDLNQFSQLSTLKQENSMFKKKINEVLEAEFVRMTVEVLGDDKGRRAFRALNIKC